MGQNNFVIKEKYMKYKSEKFENTTVALDGNTFEDCEFVNCILEYSGGKPPKMISCGLTKSTFSFSDQAADTVEFMKAMYHGGFKTVIEETFEQIRNPANK